MAKFIKLVINIIKKNQKILKFFISNGTVTVVNFIIYIIFYKIIGLNYITAFILSYIIALLLSYILNRNFVFDSSKSAERTIILYVIQKISLGLIANFILFELVSIIGLGKNISWILTTGIIFIFSYLFSKKIFEEKNIC